ncbi:uncharacterized protein METZ01_LOCUS402444 [marine metagenome]|uniref:Uncharacterized protein n=1 Tax=marine metagenome TaxID=408172 RepID=A0A382VT92_9ZZZZ
METRDSASFLIPLVLNQGNDNV